MEMFHLQQLLMRPEDREKTTMVVKSLKRSICTSRDFSHKNKWERISPPQEYEGVLASLTDDQSKKTASRMHRGKEMTSEHKRACDKHFYLNYKSKGFEMDAITTAVMTL